MAQAENIDNGLLNRDEEDGAAGELRKEKRSAADENGIDEEKTGGEPKSLRQRVMAARQMTNLKELAKEKLEARALAPAKAGTSRLLQLAWLNLIDSIGLTLIWINIHVFLHWVLGDKLFCKLGEEWLPKQVTMAGGDAAKTAGKSFGLIEVIVLLIVDLIILCVIFGTLALIVMIVDFMQASWWEKIKLFVGGLTKLDWSTVKALFQLF